MSEMSFREVLSDAQRRHIAVFCAEPRTSEEIFKSVRSLWASYSGDTLSSDLKNLETNKAVVYTSEEKWKTTETTKKVMRKYFGFEG